MKAVAFISRRFFRTLISSNQYYCTPNCTLVPNALLYNYWCEGHIRTFRNVNICLFVCSNINTYVYAGIVRWQTMVLNSARTGLHKYEECNVWIISNDEEVGRWRLTKLQSFLYKDKRWQFTSVLTTNGNSRIILISDTFYALVYYSSIVHFGHI